jgi:hypothetical protein
MTSAHALVHEGSCIDGEEQDCCTDYVPTLLLCCSQEL